jgi:hypothetical protein
MGIEKRLKTDYFDKSVSEIDSLPMNKNSYEMQNLLFDFCEVEINCVRKSKRSKGIDLFGRIKRIP